MLNRFSFWIAGAVVTQLLTAIFHATSFFIQPEPANETERQLQDLLFGYKKDMGGGISRNVADISLALSICFTLLCLLGGALNWYMRRKKADMGLFRGVLAIQVAIFGGLFIVMSALTFWPPIICTGSIFVFVLGSWLAARPLPAQNTNRIK